VEDEEARYFHFHELERAGNMDATYSLSSMSWVERSIWPSCVNMLPWDHCITSSWFFLADANLKKKKKH
jgi:hypothetical protein